MLLRQHFGISMGNLQLVKLCLALLETEIGYRQSAGTVRVFYPQDGPKRSARRRKGAGVPKMESILCTEELRRRPSRLPDYEKENRALVALLGALLDSHPNILQTLPDTILDVIQRDSSGAADETPAAQKGQHIAAE
jgi:hypothetical protein